MAYDLLLLGSGVVSNESMSRINVSKIPLSLNAVNATRMPSGDNAKIWRLLPGCME